MKGKLSATASKDKEDEGSAKKKQKTVKTQKIESEEEKEKDVSERGEASPTTTKKKGAKGKDTKQFKSLVSDCKPTSMNTIVNLDVTRNTSPRQIWSRISLTLSIYLGHPPQRPSVLRRHVFRKVPLHFRQ